MHRSLAEMRQLTDNQGKRKEVREKQANKERKHKSKKHSLDDSEFKSIGDESCKSNWNDSSASLFKLNTPKTVALPWTKSVLGKVMTVKDGSSGDTLNKISGSVIDSIPSASV